MANISINPIEKLSHMRALISEIKEESEMHFSLAAVLRDRLKQDDNSIIEFNVATILEDQLSSNDMFIRLESLINDLEKSLTLKAA